jgi:adenosylmethionine-8-amino-7-oxononanoate aminotransferase
MHFNSQNSNKNGQYVHNDPMEAELQLAAHGPGGEQVSLGRQPHHQVHVGPVDPPIEPEPYQRHGGEEGDPEEVAEEQQERDDDHGVEEVAAVVGEGPAAGQSPASILLKKKCQVMLGLMML